MDKINCIQLNSKNFLLREMSPSILQQVFEKLNTIEAMIFLGLESEEEFLKEKEKFDKGVRTFFISFLYFIIIDPNSNKHLGWCGYHTWYVPHNRAELGYIIYKDQNKGKGIMKEVLPLVLQFGFSKMNLHRVEAKISPGNLASLALIKSNHFTQEGLLRKDYLKDGIYEDSLIFSLLENEFQPIL